MSTVSNYSYEGMTNGQTPILFKLKQDLEISLGVMWESLDSPKEVMLFVVLQALFVTAGALLSAMV